MGRSIFSRTRRPQTRSLELGVEAGQVVCPGRGIVDVERCFTCRSYQGMEGGSPGRLVCTPATSLDISILPFGVVPR